MKDKKYSAKIQLIGYGIFIAIIIIYVNISSINYNYDYSVKQNKTSIEEKKTEKENKKLIEIIDDNYHYNLNLNITYSNIEEEKLYNYTGDSYKDEITINNGDGNIYYYKNNEYYKNINGEYIIIEKEEIYDNIDNNYLELNNILKYINKSALDHTTNYSNGNISSVYYLYLKNLIPEYITDDYIEISVNEKEEELNIAIDYSKFMNYKDNNIEKYIVDVTYTNINNVTE